MAGVQPVTGLAPVAGIRVTDPGAPPALIHGGPAEPVHEHAFWENGLAPYPWIYQPGIATPPGSASGLEGPDPDPARLPAGTDPYAWADPTSTGSHGAPWPSFGVADGTVAPDPMAWQQAFSFDAHGIDAGDAQARSTQADYVTKLPFLAEADLVSPGVTGLEPVPAQLMANPKTGRDRVQGYAPVNEYGFDSAHVYRARGEGHVPGDFLWLGGAQRPMVIQQLGRQPWQYPTGPDSYFPGQVPGRGSVDGATLTGLPAAYQPPPEPPAGTLDTAAAPVWSSW